MVIDSTTRQAVRHTLHCLIGCGLGEITGMLIAAGLGWPRFGQLALAIVLAFLFGYSLTYYGVRRHAASRREAFKITAATDTVSIGVMELVDNAIELIIPNALLVMPDSPRFWWGLVLALAVAFVVTVPVNRLLISRNPHTHHRGAV